MQLISLLRYCLLSALLGGFTSLLAQNGQVDAAASAAADRDASDRQLHSSSIYERRKALDALMSETADAPATTAVLIRLFRSQDAEEPRYTDFMQRVGKALQDTASKTTWLPENVELLTSVLLHNDAYDARVTNRTAATVAGVARYQAFTLKAIDDLTTILWHRVDKNPRRTRNDNTRTYVAQALRHIQQRQGLPEAVIAASVAALGSENNASVRRETLLLIDAYVQAQPASVVLVQALTGVLSTDDNATVRTLAARSLRHISEQRDYPRALITVLQQAAVGDPDAAVRREALAGLIAAAAVHPLSPEVLSPEATGQLLQAAVGDADAGVRFQVLQVLAKVYATQAPDPATLKLLVDRLGEEHDDRVRVRIAVILGDVHTRQGLVPAVIEVLIPLVTDDPAEAVRQALSRILFELPEGQGLAIWMQTTADMGLSQAGAATTVVLPERSMHVPLVEQPDLRARLLGHYVEALSEGRARAVRAEILQGLFALSLTEPLPQQAVDVLARSLVADTDAGLRHQAAAVLLYNSLQQRGSTAAFYAALDDGDAQVHNYAAFALVELSAVNGDVLPGLLGFAMDPAVQRNLRVYSLRRLAQWHGTGKALPAAVQAALQELAEGVDVELRQEAWNALRQFDLTEQDWRRAAADDDLAIQRMGWWELQVLGIDKPVRAKWQDPKQRLELIAVGLLAATVLALVSGALWFVWRLLRWWRSTRQQRGKMFAAQLLWLVASFITVAADAGILFVVGMSHSGLSEKDLLQLNTLFSAILALYVAVACLAWKLLPARQPLHAA